MGYKVVLNNEQKEYIFSKTDCINKQKKLMSVWSYKIKHEDKNVSTYKLFTMYKKYHIGVSKSYFYDLMEIINNYPVETKVETKVEIEKPLENKQTSHVNHDKNLCKNKDLNKEIYNNTLIDTTVSPCELTVFAEQLMDELKIKSAFVRTLVIKNLSMQMNINRPGMLAYITKTIANVKALLDYSSKQYFINKNKKLKELQANTNKNNAGDLMFNMGMNRNYSNAEFNRIEEQLLENSTNFQFA